MIMIFEPKYLSFIVRVWLQIYKTILLLSVIITLIAFISKVNLMYATCIGILPVCALLFVRSFFIHKYYLKSVEINEGDEYVKLVVLKYNREFRVYTLALNDLMVRMNLIFFSLRPYHKLQFTKSRTIIYEQGECFPWPLEILMEVFNKIKSIQRR